MPALQLRQPLTHRAEAAMARVLQRAAAERGEAGAEDHAGIEQVGIGDDALAQAGDALIDQREDQPVGQILGRGAA